MSTRVDWISALWLSLLFVVGGTQASGVEAVARCREEAGFTPDGRLVLAAGVNDPLACKDAATAHPSNPDVYAYWARIEYQRNNFGQAAALLRQATALGSDLASVLQGIMAEFGMGRSVDTVLAAQLYRNAAEHGQRLGMHKLGEALIAGRGIERDVVQGEMWLEKAGMQDQKEARYFRALAYFDGAKSGDTDVKALKLIEELDRSGFVDASKTLAWMHMNGRGVTKSEANGIAIYERIAEKGDVDAQMVVAQAYLNGSGVAKNVDKAARWYAAAAERGSKDAAMMLGWFYQVHAKSVPLARKWYLEAAKLGAVRAYAELALLYSRSDLAPPDPVQAHNYLIQGAKLNDPTAQFYLAYQYLHGEGTPRDPAAAQQWAARAADAFVKISETGGADVLFMLAMLYSEGLGVPRDERKAAELLEKSAGMNYVMSQIWMTHILIFGQGVRQDLQRAKLFFEQAARNGATLGQLIKDLHDFTEQAVETGTNVRQWLNPTTRKVVTQYRVSGQKLGEIELEQLFTMAVAQQPLGDMPLMLFLLDNLTMLIEANPSPPRHADLAAIAYLRAWALGSTGSSNEDVERANAAADGLAERVSNAAIDNQDRATRVGLCAVHGFMLAAMLDQSPSPALKKLFDLAQAVLPPELRESVLALKTDSNDPAKLMLRGKRLMEEVKKDRSLAPVLDGYLDVMSLLVSENANVKDFSINDKNARQFENAALRLQAGPEGLDALRSVIFDELSRWHESHGRTSTAIYYGKLAVAAFESGRTGFTKEEGALERKYLESRGSSYRRVAAMLARAGRFAESELILRALRFDELTQTENRARAGESVFGMETSCYAAECLTLQRQKDISARYLKAVSKLRTLQTDAPATLEQIKQEERELARLRQLWDESAEPLLAKADEKTGPVSSTTIRDAGTMSEKIHAALSHSRHHFVTIRYLVLPDELVLIVSTSAPTPIVIETATKERDLNDLIGLFRGAIQAKSPDVRKYATRLFDMVLKPVAQLLGPDDKGALPLLMISPDRGLKMVPFTALYDGNVWIVQKWPIAYFSDAVLENLGKPPEGLSAQAFGTTKPVVEKKLAALAYVEEELAAVRGKFGKDSVHIDDEFTREKLYQAFRRNKLLSDRSAIVHVATHFLINFRTPAASELIVGKGDPVRQEEIEAWGVANTGLLILSACNTGLAIDVSNGTASDAFLTKLQIKGAHAVMATLWEVNDQSSSRLMQEFYRYRYAGNVSVDKATALQSAQQRILTIKGWEHPYYWAPFVVYGNWR